jgi:hypothetical protein
MFQISIERARQLSPPSARRRSRLFSVSLFAGENLSNLALEKFNMPAFILKNRGQVRADIGQQKRKLQPESFISEQLHGERRPLSWHGRKLSTLMRMMTEYRLKLLKMPLLVLFMPL